MMTNEELRERLAAIEHERWADWQAYVHRQGETADGNLILPGWLVALWQRQIDTPYDQLTEAEKESDREEVDRYWALLGRDD